MVRYFDDENITYVVADTSTNMSVDPARDIGIADIELIMANVEMMERRIDRVQETAKGDKRYPREVEMFSTLKDWLSDDNSARPLGYDEDGAVIIAVAELLFLRSTIHAANLDEEGPADCHTNTYYRVVEELAAKGGAQVISVCVKPEAEVAELGGGEKKMFPGDPGITKSGLDRLTKVGYALLGLTFFLTSDEDKCRAWTIRRDTKAP